MDEYKGDMIHSLKGIKLESFSESFPIPWHLKVFAMPRCKG